MREKIRKRQLMNFQGLFWIKKVKIKYADRERQRSNNFEKLNRPYIQERHQEIGKQQEKSVMGELREIPT